MSRVLEPGAKNLAVSHSLERLSLPVGPAIRAGYVAVLPTSGTQVEGQITVLVSPHAGVVFDARTPRGIFGFLAEDVDHMISTAEVS